MLRTTRNGFTIIELLVVVSIIALLIGMLLPAINEARDQARINVSHSNLHNLGVAHVSYAAAWKGRQFTLVKDNIANYGNNINAFDNYYEASGGETAFHTHPAPILGWAYLQGDVNSEYLLFAYFTHESGDEQHGGFSPANASDNLPLNFSDPNAYFGSFRLPNVRQFNQYVGHRFYDKTFYAPKDTIVLETITTGGYDGANMLEDPGEYSDRPHVDGQGEIPVWSSYCMSPAAMFNPMVMAHEDPDDDTFNGWRDPWTLSGGFRSPALSQAQYPSTKTHMLEHHWLQNKRNDCNEGFIGGGYVEDCEPFYFNHALESNPVTLFYDGHVEMIGVRDVMHADARVRTQTNNPDWGLWSQDTLFGPDGYLSEYGYDLAATSFHVLTTDGIRGRDILSD